MKKDCSQLNRFWKGVESNQVRRRMRKLRGKKEESPSDGQQRRRGCVTGKEKGSTTMTRRGGSKSVLVIGEWGTVKPTTPWQLKR